MKWDDINNGFRNVTDDAEPTKPVAGKPAGDADRTDPIVLEELFDDDKPLSEEAKAQQIKLLKQRGFQIATLDEYASSSALHAETERIKMVYQSRISGWQNLFLSVIDRLSAKKWRIYQERQEVIGREDKYEDEVSVCKVLKEQMLSDLKALETEIKQVRRKIAEAKKSIGGRLVEDAERELDKAVQLQKKIHNDLKAVNEDRFKNQKPALDELLIKWKNLRDTYNEQFQKLNARIKELSDFGITSRVANTLLSLGTAMAGVAGYFYSIFSAKARYSTNDVLFYLLKNLINVCANPAIDLWAKFIILVAGVLVITIVSWIVDGLLRKANFYKKEEEDTTDIQELETDFSIKGFKYFFRTKQKRWLLLWLKIAPLILVVGSVLLIISYGQGVDEQTDKLSSSTEGLLIGTAIAMGIAAVIYLYITKVSEARAKATNLTQYIKYNWELVVSMLVFIAAMVGLAFYKQGGDEIPYSIASFIGACLITGFAFSYGMRFHSLRSLANEIVYQIRVIDRAIASITGPYQPNLALNPEHYFRELGQGLIMHLEKKNEVISNSDELQQISMLSDEPVTKSKNVLRELFIVTPKEKDLENTNLFEIMEWELRYFPDLAEELKTLAGLYKSKKVQLEDAADALKQSIADKLTKLAADKINLDQLNQEIEGLEILVNNAKLRSHLKLISLENEYVNDITNLNDGFDLGNWYLYHNMGPNGPQLLLN